GAPVLVVGGAGPGSIGLYAAGLAVTLGAESVLYVDDDEARRRTAEALGASTLAEMPKRLGPFPITVDASGDPDGLRLALRSAARRACSAESPDRRPSRRRRPGRSRSARSRACPGSRRWG